MDTLSKNLSRAEGLLDVSLYLISSEKRMTRREAKAIMATIGKIQYVGDRIAARAFRLKPKATIVRRGGKLVIKSY